MTSAKSAHHRPDDAALCVSRSAHDVSAIERLFTRGEGRAVRNQLSTVIDGNRVTLAVRFQNGPLGKRRAILFYTAQNNRVDQLHSSQAGEIC